jgi:dienelactone hydrolase
MGIIIFIIIAVIEIAIALFCIVTKSYHNKTRNVARIIELSLFVLLTLLSVIEWGFRWKLFALLLLLNALLAVWQMLRCKQTPYSTTHVIVKTFSMLLIVILTLTPALLFPQYKLPNATGEYNVATVTYTYSDQNRIENFTNTGEHRNVNVEFWYPDNAEGTYPLVVFSHGSFGVKKSNESTFRQLASHGYVICSIDHPYHSSFTLDATGKATTVAAEFVNEYNAMGTSLETGYQYSQKWLKLRTEDINFVLDTIINKAKNKNNDTAKVYQLINEDKIGVFGHSLGGASVSAVARQRNDIDAVINLDGPFWGDLLGIENGKSVINTEKYPSPLLTVYTDSLWGKMDNDPLYAPNVRFLSDTQQNIYNIHFSGALHMNLCDLSLISPTLSNIMQGGNASIDAYNCIQTLNETVLDFFNCYLKGDGNFTVRESY